MSLIRAYIAMPLPEACSSELQLGLAQLRSRCLRASLRVSWVPRENLHLTLRFLGTTDERDLPILAEALDEVASRRPPLRMSLGALGVMPSGTRPRVLYVGLSQPAGVSALAQDVSAALTALGLSPADRPFAPHITIARIRDARSGQALSELLRPFADHAFSEPAAFDLMCIVESQLRYAPPLYIPRHQLRLRGPGDPP